MAVARIHHLGLTVTDVEASANWYTTVLGFHRVGEHASPDGARRKVFLRHDRFDIRLGLCEHSAKAATSFDETRPGLDHLAFGVDDAQELAAWEQRLTELEVSFTPVTRANTLEGSLVVVLRDPDNIQLELIADPSCLRASVSG